MNDTLKVIETQSAGLSDTVLLAIVAGIVAIATLIIKGIIESHAKKAETKAALEAARVTHKLEAVELKIDGRLTQLLEISKKEAEERGHRLGKEQAKSEEIVKVAEPSTALPDTGPVKLTITEGEIKVVPETTKKKPNKS